MASGRSVPVDLVDPLRKDHHPNLFLIIVDKIRYPKREPKKEKIQDLPEMEKKWAVTADVTDADDNENGRN
jgi:hypothetical protein